VDYFATRVSLGPKGITKIHELGSLSEYEETAIKDCVKALQQNINTALEYTRIDRQDK
jgi:malate dehydrogenase